MESTYNMELHRWEPQCPYGVMCSGCDAAGLCTRMEPYAKGAALMAYQRRIAQESNTPRKVSGGNSRV